MRLTLLFFLGRLERVGLGVCEFLSFIFLFYFVLVVHLKLWVKL